VWQADSLRSEGATARSRPGRTRGPAGRFRGGRALGAVGRGRRHVGPGRGSRPRRPPRGPRPGRPVLVPGPRLGGPHRRVARHAPERGAERRLSPGRRGHRQPDRGTGARPPWRQRRGPARGRRAPPRRAEHGHRHRRWDLPGCSAGGGGARPGHLPPGRGRAARARRLRHGRPPGRVGAVGRPGLGHRRGRPLGQRRRGALQPDPALPQREQALRRPLGRARRHQQVRDGLRTQPSRLQPNPYSPADAITSAARYLAAAGAVSDLARAVFAYNHSESYVLGVLTRAAVYAGAVPIAGIAGALDPTGLGAR
jgi:hypothetical protein